MNDLVLPVPVFVGLEKIARLALKLGDLRTIDAINTRLKDINCRLIVCDGKLYLQQTLPAPLPPDDESVAALIEQVNDLFTDRDKASIEHQRRMEQSDADTYRYIGAIQYRCEEQIIDLAPQLASALLALQQQRAATLRALDTLIEVADHNVATHMNNGGRGIFKAQAKDLRALKSLLAGSATPSGNADAGTGTGTIEEPES